VRCELIQVPALRQLRTDLLQIRRALAMLLHALGDLGWRDESCPRVAITGHQLHQSIEQSAPMRNTVELFAPTPSGQPITSLRLHEDVVFEIRCEMSAVSRRSTAP